MFVTAVPYPGIPDRSSVFQTALMYSGMRAHVPGWSSVNTASPHSGHGHFVVVRLIGPTVSVQGSCDLKDD